MGRKAFYMKNTSLTNLEKVKFPKKTYTSPNKIRSLKTKEKELIELAKTRKVTIKLNRIKDSEVLNNAASTFETKPTDSPTDNFLIKDSELLESIKNMSTSSLINSIINVDFFKSKLESPNINDLNVADWELELFRKSNIETAKSKQDKQSKLFLKNPSNKIVRFGDYEIESWFKSAYPTEYWEQTHLYICKYCLTYVKSEWTLIRHMDKCSFSHPPGTEIYRKELHCFFEVDGKLNKLYCQNLCLLAKLFLNHKTLYFGKIF
jgi:hypothetical protein